MPVIPQVDTQTVKRRGVARFLPAAVLDWLVLRLGCTAAGRALGLGEQPIEFSFRLGPVLVDPTDYGEIAMPLNGSIDPGTTNIRFSEGTAITGLRWERFGRPLGAADSRLSRKRLLGELERHPIDKHNHRIHVHHVNVWTMRAPGHPYYQPGGAEVFAGAGHDLAAIEPNPPYFYLVEAGDQWHYQLDVRNGHVDPADVRDDDPPDLATDQPWQVFVKLIVTVDHCAAKRIRNRVLPFRMAINPQRHPAWTIDVTDGVVSGNPPHTTARPTIGIDIRRQDGGMYPTDGVEYQESFASPFTGSIIGLGAHLHNGAASLELHDAGGQQLGGWRPRLSEADHPIHVLGHEPTAPSAATPIPVSAGDRLFASVRYSRFRFTTRDEERAAGRDLDGSGYDYNNQFEPHDAMAVVGLMINPTF